MIPPFAWVGELVPFFLRWGHKSQHVCHNVHKKLLVRSLFYTCIYFELTKHLGCGFKDKTKPLENFADLVRWQLQKVDPHIGAVA